MRLALAVVLSALLIASGCDNGNEREAEETREKLVGTWLREVDADGAKGRRVLVLGADGHFSEAIAAQLPDGHVERHERTGEWAFDGTNLKRRYTHEDSRMMANNFAFVTFEITLLTPREFEGKNHVHGEQVSYRRVPPGTTP